MDRLVTICKEYTLPLLEDAAEALGSEYKKQYAGTIGDIGCFSFNGNKIMTTGGGGMIMSRHLNFYSKQNIFQRQLREIL